MLTHILIFTGAGSSVQFNKPDTSGFKQQLSKKYEGSGLMKSFLDCPGFEDIEHVLESLKDFELAHNNHMTQYLKNATLPGVDSNTADFFNNLTSQRDNLRSDIMSDLFQTYKWDGKNDDEKTKKFYGDLFNIVSKYSSKVYVGTTNYDQSIEQGCALSDLKYECIDGFEYFKGDILKWNGKKFTEKYNGQGTPVYLYKIHGSLTWKHDGSGNIEKNTRNVGYERGSGENVLIAPTLSPKTAQSKEPFKTLLMELENKLEYVDVCIVIGFSFRDKHVGELFKKFIENGKNFIVISPNGFINYCVNLFDKKLNSDEARSAWYRQHRTGKNIHFIPERVDKDNNNKVFKQLEETLSKISNTIITSNTKIDKKINQTGPINKNDLSQKGKEELVTQVYRPSYNAMKNVYDEREFIFGIPVDPWKNIEHFWRLRTEPEMRILFEKYSEENQKWEKLTKEFDNTFKDQRHELGKIVAKAFEKSGLLHAGDHIELDHRTTIAPRDWLHVFRLVIFDPEIKNANELFNVLLDHAKKTKNGHQKWLQSWWEFNNGLFSNLLDTIHELIRSFNCNISKEQLDKQREILKKLVEELTETLENKLRPI